MVEHAAPSEAPRVFEAIKESQPISPKLTRTNTAKLTRTGSNASHPRRTLSRTNTHLSHKETHRDPDLDINLPYRTFTENANLEEYTSEKPEGEIDGGRAPDGQRYKLVTFTPNDPGNPKNWSKLYKW